MNPPFSQTVTFKLNKAHFQECFEQSMPPVEAVNFLKAGIIGLIGVGLMFIEAEHYYIPFFLITLAIIEVLSVVYRKPWWVWRQLMSRAANSEVTLTVDDEGIFTKSIHVESKLSWSDVNSIERTLKGFLIKHSGGMNYLSGHCLNEEIVEFFLEKKKEIEV